MLDKTGMKKQGTGLSPGLPSGMRGASSHCEGLLDSGTSHLGEAECTPPLQPPWHRWGSFSASPGGKEKLVNCYQFFPHFYVSSSCLTFDYLIKISKRSLFSLSSIRLHYHSSESLNIKDLNQTSGYWAQPCKQPLVIPGKEWRYPANGKQWRSYLFSFWDDPQQGVRTSP